MGAQQKRSRVDLQWPGSPVRHVKVHCRSESAANGAAVDPRRGGRSRRMSSQQLRLFLSVCVALYATVLYFADNVVAVASFISPDQWQRLPRYPSVGSSLWLMRKQGVTRSITLNGSHLDIPAPTTVAVAIVELEGITVNATPTSSPLETSEYPTVANATASVDGSVGRAELSPSASPLPFSNGSNDVIALDATDADGLMHVSGPPNSNNTILFGQY